MPKVGHTRQKQIRNLRFSTVTAAQTATAVKPNEVCFVKEKNSHYYYEPNGTHLVVNWDTVLSTGDGGNTRLFKLYPSVSRKVSVTATTPELITHNLNTPNVHVSVVRDWDEVDVEVYWFTDDTITIRTDVTWTYEVMITRVERLTNYIYASLNWELRRINPDTMVTVDTISIPWTDMSAVTRFDWFIYAWDQWSTNNFYKINPDTGLVVATLNIPWTQFWPIKTDWTFLYVVDWSWSRVLKIDPSWGMSLVTTMVTGWSWARTLWLILDLDRDLWYVTNHSTTGTNTVEEFTLSTMALNIWRSVGYWANKLRWCVLVWTILYVSRINYDAGDWLYRVDTETMTDMWITILWAWCGHPKLYQWNIYVNAYSANRIFKVNPFTMTFTQTVAISWPRNVWLYAGKWYAVWYFTNLVTEFNTSDMSLTWRTNDLWWWTPLWVEVL